MRDLLGKETRERMHRGMEIAKYEDHTCHAMRVPRFSGSGGHKKDMDKDPKPGKGREFSWGAIRLFFLSLPGAVQGMKSGAEKL